MCVYVCVCVGGWVGGWVWVGGGGGGAKLCFALEKLGNVTLGVVLFISY